jgi:two-component system, cell cycle response regulator
MCDIDHFTHINDSHGHPIGDEVLKSFADRLNETLRHGTDWVARVGGEEFAVVLPEATLPQAEAIAWRLCERIRDVPFQTPATQLQVTASFGLCSLGRIRSPPTELPERLINLADAALYESKRNGRDRLTTREFPDTHG